MLYSLVKRMLDILLSLVLIVVFMPFLLILSLLIIIDSPGSPLFRQVRCGQNQKRFTILKFRTMYTTAPKYMPTQHLDDADVHITRIGLFLRKTSLDEIPQLFNILLGQMSFIGPRPVICSEMDLIDGRKEMGVDKVKVGLTGWAQINGRDHLELNEKISLDAYYVDNFGPFIDFLCFIKTFGVVLSMKGHANVDDDKYIQG